MNPPLPAVDELPRVYTLQHQPEPGELLDYAAGLAAAGAEDATLVLAEASQPRVGEGDAAWPLRDGDLAFALVIHGELDGREIGQVGLLLATALAQAAADTVSPLTLLQLRWPDTLLLNEGRLGRIWLRPDSGDASRQWLVVAAALNLPERPEALALDYASLVVDGAAECEAAGLLVDVARRFLRLLNHWPERGLAECRHVWTGRVLAPEPYAGADCTLDPSGDLMLETAGGRRRLALDTRQPMPD